MKTYIVKVKERQELEKIAGFWRLKTKREEKVNELSIEILANSEEEARAIVSNQLQMMKSFRVGMFCGFGIQGVASMHHEIIGVEEKATS